MAEWGYLLRHLDGQYLSSSVFRAEVIKAKRGVGGDRIPLLVDIALAALDYSGDDWELDKALTAAGYLPNWEEDDEGQD